MKVNLYILFAFILHFSNVFVSAKTPLSVDQKARLDAIAQRALNGNDPQALAETIDFPPDIILPYLEQYIIIHKDEKGPYFEAARDTFIKIPNYEKPYADKLAAATSRGGVDREVFEFLSLLGTAKAGAIVAPYLFSLTETPMVGDQMGEANMLSAVNALGEMNLENAPPRKGYGNYKAKDVLEWQQWAIDKGFVPKTTKPAVPQWLIDLSGTSTPHIVPTPLESAPMTTPITSLTLQPSPSPKLQNIQSTFPITIGVTLFLTVVAGIILYRRKS